MAIRRILVEAFLTIDAGRSVHRIIHAIGTWDYNGQLPGYCIIVDMLRLCDVVTVVFMNINYLAWRTVGRIPYGINVSLTV